MKRLKRLKKVFKSLVVAFAFLVIVGFTLCVGAIGNFDLASEMGVVLTYSEEIHSYWLCGIGLALMLIGCVGSNFCDQVRRAINREIKLRKKAYISRKNQEQC